MKRDKKWLKAQLKLKGEITLKLLAIKKEQFTIKSGQDQNWHFKNNPFYHLATAKSAFVIAVPYKLFFTKSKIPYGKLASIGLNEDYHKVLYNALASLANSLTSVYGSFDYKIFVDKHGLDDKKFAMLCGMGTIGKNRLLLNKNYGTTFNIGYLLTDLELDYKDLINTQDYCKNCRRCITACPTGALVNGAIDLSKCRSAINQKKGVLNLNECALLGDWLYGCDICQYACPFNRTEKASQGGLLLSDVLMLSKSDFKKNHLTASYGYLGLTRLKRNAMIILYNQSGITALGPYKEFIERSVVLTEQYKVLKG